VVSFACAVVVIVVSFSVSGHRWLKVHVGQLSHGP
jgi:hypothetical protein